MFSKDLNYLENIELILKTIDDPQLATILRTHIKDILKISEANSASNRMAILEALEGLIDERMNAEDDV